MAGIADYFSGVVLQSKFAQIVHLEMIPQGVYIDGVFHLTSYQRNLYTGKYIEKRFCFVGVPATIAKDLPASVSVTDIDGRTHTVSFEENVTDGSSGSSIFEKYSNAVTVSKMSPHLRTVEVIERTGELFCNGVKVI